MDKTEIALQLCLAAIKNIDNDAESNDENSLVISGEQTAELYNSIYRNLDI